MTDISVNGLVKSFELGKNILDGLSFDIAEGERVGILGHNGCGKTTLFRILVGEIDYDDGSVSVASGKRIGLISQIPVYPPDWTTEDVLRDAHRELYAISARLEELAKQMESDSSDALLREYDRISEDFRRLGGYDTETNINRVANGLDIPRSMRQQPFDSLSGGERTRVNLARLILENTEILLLDEPFGALDAKVREELRTYLLHLQRKLGITTIMVTHDQEEALEISDRIIILNHGRIEQAGSPDEVYDTPENPFVFSFLGHVNIFRGRVDDGFAVLDEKSPDQIFIRPHEIRLSLRRHQGDVPAVIRSSRNLGFHTVVSLELENEDSGSYVTADLDRAVWLKLRESAVNDTVYLNFAHFKFYSEQTKKFSDYELKTEWSYTI